MFCALFGCSRNKWVQRALDDALTSRAAGSPEAPFICTNYQGGPTNETFNDWHRGLRGTCLY